MMVITFQELTKKKKKNEPQRGLHDKIAIEQILRKIYKFNCDEIICITEQHI